jgi:hypothetical protein
MKHFTIHELVDPWFLDPKGGVFTEAECWAMLNPLALTALDALRDRFGPILVNGRGYTESGLRRRDTATGAKYSQHKEGAAFDCKFLADGITPRKVFNVIVGEHEWAYSIGIRRVEDIQFTGRTSPPYFGWLHFDCKDTGPNNVNKIVIVKP